MSRHLVVHATFPGWSASLNPRLRLRRKPVLIPLALRSRGPEEVEDASRTARLSPHRLQAHVPVGPELRHAFAFTLKPAANLPVKPLIERRQRMAAGLRVPVYDPAT